MATPLINTTDIKNVGKTLENYAIGIAYTKGGAYLGSLATSYEKIGATKVAAADNAALALRSKLTGKEGSYIGAVVIAGVALVLIVMFIKK
jgi:hypothetical protein